MISGSYRRSYRYVSGFALVLAATGPLMLWVPDLQPPWPESSQMIATLFCAVVAILAAAWARQFRSAVTRAGAERQRSRVLLGAATGAIVLGLISGISYLVAFNQYVVSEEQTVGGEVRTVRVVIGSQLRPDVDANERPLRLLQESGYEPERVWTRESLIQARLRVFITFVATFVALTAGLALLAIAPRPRAPAEVESPAWAVVEAGPEARPRIDGETNVEGLQESEERGLSGHASGTGVGHRVFVSYRRDDSATIVGRICDRLASELGPGHVFKDVDNIPFGVDFVEYLDHEVEQCTVLFAVIGPQWLATGPGGDRRLNDPRDFVRIEIASALRRGIPVVPLLVDGARLPQTHEMPEDLQPLARRNGIEIRRDPDFHNDMTRLLSRLDGVTVERSRRSRSPISPPTVPD
jgi:TIR domain-containing protein